MTLSSTARQIIFWLLIVAGALVLYKLVNPGGKTWQPVLPNEILENSGPACAANLFRKRAGNQRNSRNSASQI